MYYMKKLFNAGWKIVIPSKKILHFLFVICISAWLLPVKIFAQPGANDPTFNTIDIGFGNGDGPNGSLNTLALQSDGRIMFSGAFTSYNNKGHPILISSEEVLHFL